MALALAFVPARAEPTPAAKAEIEAAFTAAEAVATEGPADIALLDQAHFRIAAGQVFVPAAAANRVMTALGNTTDPGRFGIILGAGPQAPWLVDVAWTKEGYVRDGDAKEWQADTLLDSLREGTTAANAERKARGFAPLEIIGWQQPPVYDSKTHRLLWSLLAREAGAAGAEPQSINYNSYALGREGYVTFDLITAADRIAVDKQVAHGLLGSMTFNTGKRYEDFNESTDQVAAYGLAALVGVVAVKKLGLLATAGVLFLKFWKLAAVALVAGGAAFRRFFSRSSTRVE